MKVIESKTSRVIKVGDTVTDFRGEKAEVRYLTPERNRITVSKKGGSRFDCREYYLSVFGLEIKKDAKGGADNETA